MAKAKAKRMTIDQAFEHLTEMSKDCVAAAVKYRVMQENAERAGDPDLVTACQKLIDGERKTMAAMYCVGQWFKVCRAVDAAAAAVGSGICRTAGRGLMTTAKK